MIDEYGLIKMDATASIHEQQLAFRKYVRKVLEQKGIRIAEAK